MKHFNFNQLKHALLALLLSFIAGSAWSATYKLEKVTSVEDGGLYVFEQKAHVMANSTANSALQTVDSYKTTGLTGTEDYVWELEAQDAGGFKMKNVSLETMCYLKNSSSTNVTFDTQANASVWSISFEEGIALIQNTSNSNRFLGFTSTSAYNIKAYATSNLTSGNYPHDFVVYKLTEDNTPGPVSVDVPTFSPAAGEVESGTKVTLTQANAALIMYTLDGTTPSYENTVGELYSDPIEITKDVTIKAIAVDDKGNESEVATAAYTVKQDLVDTESTKWVAGSVEAITDPDTGFKLNFDDSDVTAYYLKDAATSDPVSNASEIRVYKNSQLKFSVPAGAKITKIEFTCTSSSYATALGNATWSTGSANVESSTVTWTGTTEELTVDNDNAQTRISKIVLYYIPGAAPAVAAPTFSLAEGLYTEVKNVTITAEDGAVIHYTLDGTNPTEASAVYSAAIAIEKTTTLKAIAVKGGESSKVTSATYTIELPTPAIASMAELQAAMTATKTPATVNIQNWIVTGVAGDKFYMTDGSGLGLLGYQSGHGFSVGDKLDGTVEVNIQLYNSQPEVMALTATSNGLTVTQGQTATAAVTAIADITVAKQGAPVILKNVVYNETAGTFTDASSNSIILYDKFNVGYDAPTDGWTYDVTGVVVYNKAVAQISPVAADGIVFVSKPANYVNAPTASVAEGAYEMAITVELESADGYDIFYTLDGTEPNDADGTLYEGPIAINKTTTLKAIAVDDDGNASPVATFVYSISAPYTSIAALNADAVEGNTPVKVNMNGWKVVGVNGNQFYLTDGTDKGIVCYQKSHGFKLHDELNGTVECNLTLFNNLPEITQLTTSTEGLNVTADAPATPYEVASIASLSAANQGALVSLKNVKFDGSNFVDAAGKIQPYNQFKLAGYQTPKENYYYDVTGVVIVHNSALEIAPQEASQYAPNLKDVNVRVSAAGWATFVADADVTLPDGVTAYTMTGADTEGVLQMDEVTDVVTANTPVVLKADAAVNTTVQGHKAEKAERPTSGMLVGTYTDTDAPIPSYVLQKLDGVVAFYIVEQTMTVTAGHAFLITDEPTMGGVKAFTFDRATGIMMNEQTPSQAENVIYDMSGRRVEKMTKGLYIVNGKKVLK